jgi:Ser/Thr protein kinase RdoA (MazF antagonist)
MTHIASLAPALAQLAAVALRAYGLVDAAVAPLALSNNAVLAVTIGSRRYVLRVHRPGYRTQDETASELRLLQFVGGATTLAVPQPLLTRDGALLTIVQDEQGFERHADLLTWLEGRVCRPGRGLGLARAFQLGAALGHLHATVAQWSPEPALALPRWDADGLLTEASPYRPGPLEEAFTPEELPLVAEVARRVRDVFAKLGEGAGEWGVIHGDWILGNCQFRGLKPQLLDFDDCGWGLFLYDLCPLLGNLLDDDDTRRAASLRAAVLAGYRSQRPLPQTHEAFIAPLIAARHVASCLYAAGHTRNGAPIANRVEHHAYRIDQVRAYLAAQPEWLSHRS